MLLDTSYVILNWGVLAFLACAEGKVPVTLAADAVIFKEQPVSRLDLVNVGKECGRPGYIAHAQVIGHGLHIHLPLHALIEQERLDL